MPNPVVGLLEVYEDMAEVLLVLEIFLQRMRGLKICSVVLLPALKPACSSTTVTEKAYCSVVLALLQVAFLGKCDD